MKSKIKEQIHFEKNEMNEIPLHYTMPESIDNWRHTRMLDTINEIINYSKANEKNSTNTWVTVGDGRYGDNANYLFEKGLNDVIATSITEDNLKYAKENKYIKDYKIENAENLSFEDKTIDFILCKESYHHFPRPTIALYEMMRVAKQAIILIEPFDDNKLLNFFKRFIKFLIRGKGQSDLVFESSGNFLYRISVKEFKKTLAAIGGYNFALKGINDFYISKFESKSIKTKNIASLITKFAIYFQNILSKINLLGYGLCSIIIYEKDNKNLEDVLMKTGFKIFKVPQFKE
tara:strand:+ start:363 stop:1232 length:870 start_codon:yes stop_codon:yes gene_type:complete